MNRQINLQDVILKAQSADKFVRENAESFLLDSCAKDPGSVLLSLMDIANNSAADLASRQFCLVSIRKLITMYWSAGFESYCGPPGVNEAAKEIIRKLLLDLVLGDGQDSKIVNSSSYCIVQIAAVDFPDEWPSLLVRLYESIANYRTVNALTLLHEIFDDVISDEMFFQSEVGWKTIELVVQIPFDDTASFAAKSAAMKLYNSCLMQLTSPEALEVEQNRRNISRHIKESVGFLAQLLQNIMMCENSIDILIFKTHIYENLVLIKNDFPKKVFPTNLNPQLLSVVLNDLHLLGSFYLQVINSGKEDVLFHVNNCAINMVSFLSALDECDLNFGDANILLESLVRFCSLPEGLMGEWSENFNTFISKETGIASSYTIRDEICQYFSNIDKNNFQVFMKLIIQQLDHLTSMDWVSQEALLYLLQSCQFSNEKYDISNEEIINVLIKFDAGLNQSTDNVFLWARYSLTVVKFLDKFMNDIENIKQYVKEFIFKTIDIAYTTNNDSIKASALISFSYYSSFVDLGSVLGVESCEKLEKAILKIITDMYDDVEDDTPGFMLEVLAGVISSNPDSKEKGIKASALQLVLKLATSDPSNIQVIVEAQQCVEQLLEGVSTDDYIYYARMCFPVLLSILKGDTTYGYTSTALVSLALELLAVFTKLKPVDGNLPKSIVDFIFEPLSTLIMNVDDEEILQVSTEAFSFLISNSDEQDISGNLQPVINILERLLSTDISSSAASHVGSLLLAVFTKYANQIQEIMPKILEAAARRLISMKNISSTENLLVVFCYLGSMDPKQTVDFLASLPLDNEGHSALQLIMPKWLESFEFIRGEKKIKENIVALSKIFFLDDPRVASIIVNGDLLPHDNDLIVTRSMAKKMTDKYTQISVHEKIVKLFVSELSFQNKPSKAFDDLADRVKLAPGEHTNQTPKNDEDDDEWEDMDDILDYNKLQEYIGDSDIDDDDDELPVTQEIKETVPELLKQFFKDAISQNISDFYNIYNRLSDKDKKLLAEIVV
ncbi:HHL108Wp [Eremothecium sinecaudum]|uniref:HHL108Wp n=1 Tax=Eremothecium sinecaudum TaxID=45286 RepID=A0A0X8HWB3_9SACH|nr:HHL108Wp [Eremothecium sinecaudum]AMD22662.1 HHL108Wp [Eremothecium sinecaudum]